ncbi:MAG TPA: nucleotidyltransferase family protein [Stellaceae bacterium]|jgi:hypothetical protein
MPDIHAFSPDLKLVLACARWPLDEAGRQEIARCAAATQDWDRFLAWVERHGIAPLASRNLRQAGSTLVPKSVCGALEERESRSTRRVLGQITEAARMTRLLAEAGIRSMMIKGPVLAALAFGEVTARWSRDIDLLVDSQHVEEADRLITAAGYRRFAPDFDLTPSQHSAFLHMRCQFGYYSDSRDLILELHWRLTSNRTLFPLDETALWGRKNPIRLGGIDFQTLPDEELFLYLCVHGGAHVWFRLKWLADVAALLSRLPVNVIEGSAARARALRLERPFHEALLLARSLLAAPVPQPLLAAAKGDKVARRLADAAYQALNWRQSPGEPAETPWFNLWVSWQAFRLKSELRYRWAEFQDQICSPEDWARLPLPPWLAFLYPPLRPISWIARKFSAALSR